MKIIKAIYFIIFINAHFSVLYAQHNNQGQKHEQCATMERLTVKFERNPLLKARFTRQLETFNRMMARIPARPRGIDGASDINSAAYTIPVIFHIVLTDPSVVTDAQIFSQLEILNKNFSAAGADSTGIPVYFKSIVGKSGIQFCLAQRTADDEATTGINRITTSKTSFTAADDDVKHVATGGEDIWNGDKYLNIWVCELSGSLLGYSTFPDDGQPTEQGVVLDYRSLPGGSFANYNNGKTLCHETGHYFNLYHIWGDDNGECTGTDYVDDTPNQANSSSGCYSGVKTDNCTTGGNGILYQNYMDYSYDQCMLLFTSLQVARMETALLTYRSSLITSNACTPFITRTLDAQLKAIESPRYRICTNNFSPVVTVGNRGLKTLSSFIISAVIDNESPVNYPWTGTLNSLGAVTITLNKLIIGEGDHSLTIFVSSPNSGTDENTSNDTLTTIVQYYNAVQTISEGFEGNNFPPQGWDIVNPDQSVTWKKVTGIGKTGNASVMVDNFGYSNEGQQDYLRLPAINLINVDSAYLSFQLAASTFHVTSTTDNPWDTLEVLISKDCGASYTSLYKKWAATLVTRPTESTKSFEPTSTEWRKDSVNLTPYINMGQVMLAFRNTTQYENNIYLDDINIKTQIINPNLKAAGFLVTPNPSNSKITVEFYPNPSNLRSIQLYNMLGQKLSETVIASGQGSTVYSFDLSRFAAGTYIVRVIFSDRILVKKIIRN